MAKIINAKEEQEQTFVELQMQAEEIVHLQGKFERVHIFSEDVFDCQTCISTRGKNSATKYFLIPKKLRSNLEMSFPVRFQKLETQDKHIFIYMMDKKICEEKSNATNNA